MTITIAAIAIGIGVDDTIHYVHRFGEEVAVDWDYQAAFLFLSFPNSSPPSILASSQPSQC
jgi:predicted RND superfamily exporter protein